MAKNHNLFVGGASTRNFNSAMFPATPADVTLAAHKQGGGAGGLQRSLNFGLAAQSSNPLDPALNYYMRDNVFGNGDIINAILLPVSSLIEAVAVEVVAPGPTGLTCGMYITNGAGGAVAYDAANAVAAGAVVVQAPGFALDAVASAVFIPTTAILFAPVAEMGFEAAGVIRTGKVSQYLQILLAGVPAPAANGQSNQLGDLQLRITPILREYAGYGQY
jgi:hypothetical protein